MTFGHHYGGHRGGYSGSNSLGNHMAWAAGRARLARQHQEGIGYTLQQRERQRRVYESSQSNSHSSGSRQQRQADNDAVRELLESIRNYKPHDDPPIRYNSPPPEIEKGFFEKLWDSFVYAYFHY
jgi:hypothetical protein